MISRRPYKNKSVKISLYIIIIIIIRFSQPILAISDWLERTLLGKKLSQNYVVWCVVCGVVDYVVQDCVVDYVVCCVVSFVVCQARTLARYITSRSK